MQMTRLMLMQMTRPMQTMSEAMRLVKTMMKRDLPRKMRHEPVSGAASLPQRHHYTQKQRQNQIVVGLMWQQPGWRRRAATSGQERTAVAGFPRVSVRPDPCSPVKIRAVRRAPAVAALSRRARRGLQKSALGRTKDCSRTTENPVRGATRVPVTARASPPGSGNLSGRLSRPPSWVPSAPSGC
eukprot:SAG22_NODE_736_length_7533_cov_9.168281_2_plen_184_part_00